VPEAQTLGDARQGQNDIDLDAKIHGIFNDASKEPVLGGRFFMISAGVKRQTSSLWLEIEETKPLDEVTCASHVSAPLSLDVGFPTEASEASASRTMTIKPATAMRQLNI
jgi:hypothetical protein